MQENIVPLGINTLAKYKKEIDLIPQFLPANPALFYRKRGWIGSDDFFGKGKYMSFVPEVSKKENPDADPLRERKDYRKSSTKLSYEAGRSYVRKYLLPLGIKSLKKYKDYRTSLPKCLPLHPKKYYKNKGWISSEHFFGGGRSIPTSIGS